MKLLSVLAVVGTAGLLGLGVVMAKSNPGQVEYEEYAAQRFGLYLKENACGEGKNPLEKFLQENCDRLIQEAQPTIRGLLSATTQRRDFVFFSLYTTDLKVSRWLPGYQFETLGAFNNFYTFSAREN
ncbi:DUF4359 domain-containing protein [Calothrix sp. NIES-3974]|uniref:DUF4359 domain-containing protein n=1 Tax=Calothrix sp. NIES-3974 TaxID=2005462 RepID=UPI000B5E7E7A|nr:DUF4359 domain-containing protein [Calothrix sp. NIES-3974]BAZ06340.1 hypothetical protein NIES3974_29980 [Calothrix sp. NIES-3974]